MGTEREGTTPVDGSAPAWTDGPEEEPLPLDQEVARQFLRMERHHHALRSAGSLHAADVRLLWLLTSTEPMTLREISDTLRLEQSTVNRQVNAAIRNGLLHRFDDGRTAKVVAPTDRGREVFRRDTARTQKIYAASLAELGPQADIFVALLRQFTGGAARAIRELDL